MEIEIDEIQGFLFSENDCIGLIDPRGKNLEIFLFRDLKSPNLISIQEQIQIDEIIILGLYATASSI